MWMLTYWTLPISKQSIDCTVRLWYKFLYSRDIHSVSNIATHVNAPLERLERQFPPSTSGTSRILWSIGGWGVDHIWLLDCRVIGGCLQFCIHLKFQFQFQFHLIFQLRGERVWQGYKREKIRRVEVWFDTCRYLYTVVDAYCAAGGYIVGERIWIRVR